MTLTKRVNALSQSASKPVATAEPVYSAWRATRCSSSATSRRVDDGLERHHLGIALGPEPALGIPYVRDPAAHARGEVPARGTQDDRAAARHVLAAVIADAFHHRPGARVAHAETFRGDAPEVGLTRGGAVEDDVADQDLFLRAERARTRRIDDQAAPGKALADVVVGIAFHFERHASREPGAEALPRATLELEANRVVREHPRADAPDDLVGQHASHHAIDVLERQRGAHRLAAREGRLREPDQLVVEGLVETVVLGVHGIDAQAVLGLPGR